MGRWEMNRTQLCITVWGDGGSLIYMTVYWSIHIFWGLIIFTLTIVLKRLFSTFWGWLNRMFQTSMCFMRFDISSIWQILRFDRWFFIAHRNTLWCLWIYSLTILMIDTLCMFNEIGCSLRVHTRRKMNDKGLVNQSMLHMSYE